MKKKLFGLIICMMMIPSVVPGVESQNNIRVAVIPQNNTFQACVLENWTEIQKILASDGEAEDDFGSSIAINGEYVLIGAYNDDSYRGSAYVFKRSGISWVQEAKLLASDGTVGDAFGISVSLSDNYAVIGAYASDSYRGSAYIFKRNNTSWVEEEKLSIQDGAPSEYFGRSVTINGDYVIIGAYGDDSARGSAYVFKRNGTAWVQEAKLLANDGEADDFFGGSISMGFNYIVIGAPGADSSRGSAYIFTQVNMSWMQETKLLASDGGADDWFGISVSVSDDTVVIGADGDDSARGAAYVFTKEEEENHPPDTPDQPTGETNGDINTPYTYTSTTDDSDNDQVYYNWSWGDDTYSGWLGPYNSGAVATAEHTWTTEGDYSIKVKAKDTKDGESDWSDPLPITMPCSFNIPLHWFWERFFQRFQNAFPLLRHLIGY
jgi:hypothetical protein